MESENKRPEPGAYTDEALLSFAFEDAPSFIFIVAKADERIRGASSNLERITGYTKDEVVGRSLDEVGFWTHILKADALASAGKEDKIIHLPFKKKSGEELHCIFYIRLGFYRGEPHYILTGMERPPMRDRREVGVLPDSAIRQGSFFSFETRWSRLFDAIKEISREFISADLTDEEIRRSLALFGAAVSASRAYIFEFLGEPAEAVARWVWNAPEVATLREGHRIPVKAFSPDAEELLTLLRERKCISFSTNAREPEKKELVLADTAVFTLFPVFLRERLWGFAGFSLVDTDSPLTDLEKNSLAIFADFFGAALLRHRADEQVSRTLRVLNRILDNSEALIYVSRLDTYEILFINRYGKLIFGDVTGRRCWEVLHGTHEGPCPGCSSRWLLDSSGKPAGSGYRWEFLSERNQRWYQCLDTAIEWVDGSLVRIEIAFDITERKALEDKLRESLKSRDTFFSVISHDLKNPIAGLKGVTDNLYANFQDFKAEDVREIVMRINETSEKLYNLLEDLLSWSRMQRGSMPYHPRLLFPVALLENLKRFFQEAAEKKGIEIRVEGPLELSILGDYDMVSAVLRNLLSNAIKFTPRKGRIFLTARRAPEEPDKVILAVRDTGIGIDQDFRDKLFKIDKLFSLPGTEGEEGTGLGLILCKDFLGRHGSALSVKSVPGEGSEFSFFLPAAMLPAPEKEKK